MTIRPFRWGNLESACSFPAPAMQARDRSRAGPEPLQLIYWSAAHALGRRIGLVRSSNLGPLGSLRFIRSRNHPDYFTRLGTLSGVSLIADSMFAIPACATMPEEPVNPASACPQAQMRRRRCRGAVPPAGNDLSPVTRDYPRDDPTTKWRPVIASVLSMNHHYSRLENPVCPPNVVHRVVHRPYPRTQEHSSITWCRPTDSDGFP